MELSSEKEGKKEEVTTHAAIHVLHLDGLRELHRHFLRLPDGAIVEVRTSWFCPAFQNDKISTFSRLFAAWRSTIKNGLCCSLGLIIIFHF